MSDGATISVVSVFYLAPPQETEYRLQITNTSEQSIIYRLLSTAPKRYVVRPRQGVLASGKTVHISITLTHEGIGQVLSQLAAQPEGARPLHDDFKIEYRLLTSTDAVNDAGEPLDDKKSLSDILKAGGKKNSLVVRCELKRGAEAASAEGAGGTVPAEAPKAAVKSSTTAAPRAAELSDGSAAPGSRNEKGVAVAKKKGGLSPIVIVGAIGAVLLAILTFYFFSS